MDITDENPRTHPMPVPFSQNIPKPSVPEVSLLSLNDDLDCQNDNKKDSFSGTEFQTYNAWRWKYLSGINKVDGTESLNEERPGQDRLKCSRSDECCLIRDKYSSSEVEKRKNQILYGSSDEPRRPLPPRTYFPPPNYTKMFSPLKSFNNSSAAEGIVKDTPHSHVDSHLFKNSKALETLNNDEFLHNSLKKDYINSNKLYDIISAQNKQLEVLQRQLDQILKLQDVKDKQIEQLLKSQEAKENKAKQLLQSAEVKDTEIEKLLKTKEKHEKQIQELFQLKEDHENKYMVLQKQLNMIQNKETISVGVMANVQMIEAGTNTSMKCCSGDCSKVDKVEDTNFNEHGPNGFNDRNKSLSLHSADLPAIQEHVPTPQSSIHLDIQDFHYSSDESDSGSVVMSNNCPSNQTDSNPLGYTFYNNVLSQVKDIIHNSGDKFKAKESDSCSTPENILISDSHVQENRGAIQSFQAWEVYEKENLAPLIHNHEDNNFVNRFSCEALNSCNKEYSPSDISLKMNSLALKYLKQEQISQYNIPSQINSSRQADVTIYNVTNLSFGTTRYLDRYRILPNIKENSQLETHIYQNTGCLSAQNKKKRSNTNQ